MEDTLETKLETLEKTLERIKEEKKHKETKIIDRKKYLKNMFHRTTNLRKQIINIQREL